MEPNLVSITDGITQQDVGICYFDPDEEAIKEIGPSSGYIFGAEPYSASIHKLMFVTSVPNISSAVISIKSTPEIKALYDIKICGGLTRPPLSDFDSIPLFNEYKIIGPIQAHSLVPFFVYVKAKSEITNVDKLGIEVKYEF